jgi:hypothetical protein
MCVYCRPPSPEELQQALVVLPHPTDRREAVEDLFWALFNTPEFLFID